MTIRIGRSMPTENVALHWEADDPYCWNGGTIFRDASGNSNMSYGGSPTLSTAKGYTSALLDGVDDYIQAQHTTPAVPARTISMVYSLEGVQTTGRGPLWRVSDWRERIFVGSTTLIPNSGTYYNVSTGYGSFGTMHHHVYQYNGATMKGWGNGSLLSDISTDSDMQANTSHFYRFGNQSGGSSNIYVDMHLFNVTFWDAALTNEEVDLVWQRNSLKYGLV
jgi:hypothetical protein